MDKVRIESFTDRERRQTGTKKVYQLPVNPETYTQNLQVEYDNRRGHGSDAAELRYKSTKPRELRFEFIFDDTQTIEGYGQKGKSLTTQMNEFLSTVYDIDGVIHRPRFLEIHWGQFEFPCLLKTLDINYTLFHENGDPIRAKLNATFAYYQTTEESQRERRNNSPDLTHRRLVQPGERLDLMTYKIYNDSKYVLQVADANELTSIRNIRPLVGREIQFPPLDKTEPTT